MEFEIDNMFVEARNSVLNYCEHFFMTKLCFMMANIEFNSDFSEVCDLKITIPCSIVKDLIPDFNEIVDLFLEINNRIYINHGSIKKIVKIGDFIDYRTYMNRDNKYTIYIYIRCPPYEEFDVNIALATFVKKISMLIEELTNEYMKRHPDDFNEK